MTAGRPKRPAFFCAMSSGTWGAGCGRLACRKWSGSLRARVTASQVVPAKAGEGKSRGRLEPEDFLAIGEVGKQHRRRPFVEHGAVLQREDAVGQRQHEVEIVLNDKDRDVLAQPVEYAEQLENDGGRQALEGFV